MDYVTLGKTGLRVSVAGLGCGGKSRLGGGATAAGVGSEDTRVRIVREALALGVNYIDTAPTYGTEDVVGAAVKGHREEVVIATKVHPVSRDGAGNVIRRLTVPELNTAVRSSLARLRTETIDVLLLHGVLPGEYEYCLAELLPGLQALKRQGIIRFVGISESFVNDPAHELMQCVARDGFWDVILVGFNLLNVSAMSAVLPSASKGNMGVTLMYAVRDLLSKPVALQFAIRRAVAEGAIQADSVDMEDPLGFLVHDSGAASLVEAAYRFARHESGAHVVLTGTGSLAHLRQNVESINAAALPIQDVERVMEIFGRSTFFTGEEISS
jgi:L-galactose dehydrogenase